MVIAHVARSATIMGLILTLMLPCKALAIPAFSRQIHADCRTCHFQSMGALNAYGRAFMRNGFQETERMRKQRLQREKAQKQKQKKPDNTNR